MSRCTPVARVLTEPCLILGVEKPIAIANFVIAMVIAGELHIWGFFFLSLALHITLAQVTRRDPFTRKIYIRYIRQAATYLPWVMVSRSPSTRPMAYHGVLI